MSSSHEYPPREIMIAGKRFVELSSRSCTTACEGGVPPFKEQPPASTPELEQSYRTMKPLYTVEDRVGALERNVCALQTERRRDKWLRQGILYISYVLGLLAGIWWMQR